MAGRGPAPKDPATRRRRNLTPPPTILVAAAAPAEDESPILRGPALPGNVPWHEQTLLWWDTWRTAPQAQAMTTTDWDFLLDTAVLHDMFWSGQVKVAAELRLRVAKFGATPEDRMRLRMQVTAPPEGVPEPAKAPSRYTHLRAVKEA